MLGILTAVPVAQAAPISPADLYTARSGGLYGSSQALTPYLAGMDGAGIVAKVRAQSLTVR